jgi:hypothetical protein
MSWFSIVLPIASESSAHIRNARSKCAQNTDLVRESTSTTRPVTLCSTSKNACTAKNLFVTSTQIGSRNVKYASRTTEKECVVTTLSAEIFRYAEIVEPFAKEE